MLQQFGQKNYEKKMKNANPLFWNIKNSYYSATNFNINKNLSYLLNFVVK